MTGSARDTANPQLVAVCFAANDPLRLASFWAAALQWDVGGATDDGVDLVPTDGTRFRIRFGATTDQKIAKNRIHLDLTSTSVEHQTTSVRELIQLGARHIDIGQGPDASHVVLADPEGNELCIIEPDNTFLAGCGRLGSVTCDGSPAVGHFWSDVLGWPMVWDQDEETAIRAPDGTAPFVTWGLPVPTKIGKNRVRLEIALSDDGDQRAEIDRLLRCGATRIDTPAHGPEHRVMLADPDGNEFCVSSR